jgi:phenylacetic acid degradation operon negative regulatory protein
MSSPIRDRLDHFRAQPRAQAASLIVSLFGDAVAPHGSRIWLGSIIRLLEPLGLSERLVRTSVFRLAQNDWLASEAVGRRSDYLLTPSGQRRVDEAARHIYASWAPLWDRRWRLILVVGQLEAKSREALRQALFWQGFGGLGQDCFVHPSADLAAAFDALVAEGLGELLGQLVPVLGADAQLGGSASNGDLVRRAWNLDDLAQAYGEFVAAYLPSLAALRRDRHAAVDPEEAFLLRLLLIHDYRRLLLRDPQLPEVLLPAEWPGQQARVLCKELYRRLAAPSEEHLARWLRTADEGFPPLDGAFARRFPADDPLAAIAA